MKLTTTILILFVCFGCKVKEKKGGTVNQYDTQKVIMLVCDTSKGQMYIYQKFAHVIYGYIVKEAYLDTDKKPLSKSIIVWQTKELK